MAPRWQVARERVEEDVRRGGGRRSRGGQTDQGRGARDPDRGGARSSRRCSQSWRAAGDGDAQAGGVHRPCGCASVACECPNAPHHRFHRPGPWDSGTGCISALGTGASAHVFLAEDVSLQRHVAVKVLQPALATDEAFLKRFRAEARSVASLNHPHVLRVFDWGEDADGPYLVLEYLGGGSLRDMLDRGSRLSHAQAAPSVPRRPRAWPTPTPGAWSTATSSRPTSSSTRRAGCAWPTSGWPGPWPRRPDRAGRGHGGHGPLRLARTGRGQAGRRPGRRLLPGPGPLRGASPAGCPSSPTPPWAR